MPKEAKRKLSDVPTESTFKMHFGTELRNLEDLYHVLNQIGDASFKKHVSKEKNDFADWIRYSIIDVELADRLEMTTDIGETKAVIKSRIGYLKNKLKEAKSNYYKIPEESKLNKDLMKDLRNKESHFVSGIYSKKETSDFASKFPDILKLKKKTSKTKKSKKESNYEYPPPNNDIGYEYSNNLSTNPYNNPEMFANAMKRNIKETIRDVLIGVFFGLVIGFFIALSIVGLV